MNEQHLRTRQEKHHAAYLAAQNEGDYPTYQRELKEYENVTQMLNDYLRSCEG